jgi:hypothetical protein
MHDEAWELKFAEVRGLEGGIDCATDAGLNRIDQEKMKIKSKSKIRRRIKSKSRIKINKATVFLLLSYS